MLGRLDPRKTRTVADDRHRSRRIQTLVTHQGSRFTTSHRGDPATAIDRRYLKITRLVNRVASHIAAGAVRKMSDHDQLLLAVCRLEQRLLREDLDSNHPLGDVEPTTLRNPTLQQAVDSRVFIEQEPALVRHTLGRLQQHQALRGSRPVESPTRQIVDQCTVVVQRVVTTQGQRETTLALLGPVAGAGIAAHLADHRDHVAHKTHRRIRQRRDLHRHVQCLSTQPDLDRRATRLPWHDESVRIDRHQVAARSECHKTADVETAARRIGARDNQTTTVPDARQSQARRIGTERLH